MAIPVLTPNFTILSTCDAVTGWTGLATLDTEFFVQGNASVSGTTRTTGDRYFTPSSPVNLSNTHIRMWFNFSAPSFLANKSVGGISIYLYDGTNTARYYVAGKDTYNGGWILLTLDTTKTPDSGSINISSVTRIGVTITLTSSPRNAVNTWIDYLVYGSSIVITGGSLSDPIDMDGIAEVDLASGYGAIRKINGVFFINTAITIGDLSGSLDTYFEDDNRILVFEDQPVNSDLYKLEAVGSSTNISVFKLSNTVLKSASIQTRFDLLLDNANLDELIFDSNTIINADETKFKTGQTVKNSIWNGCNLITPSGAIFINNTISNSPATNAIQMPDPSILNIESCKFINNINAILITISGTYVFDSLIFESNDYDINNTSGVLITINATNGSNPATYLGSVTIVNSVTVTLTGVKENSEITILRHGTTTVEAYINNSAANGEFNFTYNSPPVGFTAVDIFIVNPGYKWYPVYNYTLPASPATLPIAQQVDNNYIP